MDTLNLPSFNARIRQNPQNGLEEIWDTQRKKWVKLTPEEWVRQHFVHYLIDSLQYPSGRIGNEISIKVGQLERRCDTVIFGDDTSALMIIEYKATSVTLTQQVFDQVSRYNLALKVDWLIVSNGLNHYCCHLNRSKNCWEFVREIPTYQELIRR